MIQPITLLDSDYNQWIKELCDSYRQSQIKASIKVNSELLHFYWCLGRDIVIMQEHKRWGDKLIDNLSRDLQHANPDATCFSVTNLIYIRNFYKLYKNVPQLGEHLGRFVIAPQAGEQLSDSIVERPQTPIIIQEAIFSIPWGHHKVLIDKCKDQLDKALFYVLQTKENGWSRSMLLNQISSGFYERNGKALTNFTHTLPDAVSDLANEITKDPYCFAFTGITGQYNERLLKDALLNNITRFLTELGTGFAYVGKEYRLKIGNTENFIDLLFYNLNLSCYIVVEVKIGKFVFADVGQLGGYVVACNHLLRKAGRDNPTIGLLICKEKDRVQAQYALESSSQPLAISEYELEKFYPEKVEGTMPTLKEIETKLFQDNS